MLYPAELRGRWAHLTPANPEMKTAALRRRFRFWDRPFLGGEGERGKETVPYASL